MSVDPFSCSEAVRDDPYLRDRLGPAGYKATGPTLHPATRYIQPPGSAEEEEGEALGTQQ